MYPCPPIWLKSEGDNYPARGGEHALPVAFLDVWPFPAQQAAGYALEAVYQIRHRHLRRILNQKMNLIVLAVHLDQARLEVGTDLGEDAAQGINGRAIE